MEFISTLNAIKSVFSTLGAKTSDSNYAVQLCDKTSGEPKGFMGMSDLASVLGVLNNFIDAAKNANYYFRSADVGSGTFSITQIPLKDNFNNWGFCGLILISGGGDYGAYIFGNNSSGFAVTALKQSSTVTSISYNPTDMCMKIEHTDNIVVRIVHNIAWILS